MSVKVHGRNLILSGLGMAAVIAVGLALREPRLDSEAPLQPRDVPGLRISVPGWESESEAAEYWGGFVHLRRGPRQMVRLSWGPEDLAPTEAVDKLYRELTVGLQSLGSDTRPVASRPATTHYQGLKALTLAITTFSCGDGRQLSLSTFGPAALSDVQRLHWRMLESVSCVGAAAPPVVYPAIALPAEFSETARSPSHLLFESNGEWVWLSSAPLGKQAERIVADPGIAVALPALFGVAADGELEVTSVEKAHRAWRLPVRNDDEKKWLTAALLACGEQRFLLVHLGPRARGPALGPQRIAVASCPK